MTVAERVVSGVFGKHEAIRRPLSGVRIIDFGQVILLPFATRWLAWLGAEVILIEFEKARVSARHAAIRIRPLGT